LKGGSRALILSLVLFLTWGTILSAPFRFFALAFRNAAEKGLDSLSIPTALSGWLIAVILAMVTIGLLFLSSKPVACHIGGICALISISYYVYTCIRTKSIDPNMITVTAGLAAALLFLLFQTEKPNRWLGDAYILSIPVMMFFELVLSPLFSQFQIEADLLAPVISVPESGIADRIGDFLTLPTPVWTLFIYAMAMVAIAFFSRGRE
jgi:glucan phosphoethanolaminetransferase (alkaline phosphatase superfamily)